MAFPTVSGVPNYSGTAIPQLWSARLIKTFYENTVLSQITNTEYEGEIRRAGDTINIRQGPTVPIRQYVAGQVLEIDTPEIPVLQMVIDKGLYFNVTLDDVHKFQSDIDLMNRFADDAANQLRIEIEKDVLSNILPEVAPTNKGTAAGAKSGAFNLGATGSPVTLNKTNVLDFIVDLGTVLDESLCPEDGRYLLLPPRVVGLIKKSDLKDASLAGDSTSILRNGRVGVIDRFTVYNSQLLKTDTDGAVHVIAGHKYGLAFAAQISETETMRSEKTFATLLRGLKVYGYKVIKPEVLAEAVVTV